MRDGNSTPPGGPTGDPGDAGASAPTVPAPRDAAGEPGSVHVILSPDRTTIVLSGEVDADLGPDLAQATTDAEEAGVPIEVGVVGGEEDGHEAEINEKLYTTAEDGLATVRALGAGEKGRYLTALTFGNVHGVYKPGAVKLRPSILAEIQKAVGAEIGKTDPFDLVFHGGSGSTAAEIAEAVDNGVIKMNIDTDTQYAFTRPVVGHMFSNYDGVLKVDGEVGNKKAYDPRAWGKLAEAGMAARIVEAAQQLRSAGNKLR